MTTVRTNEGGKLRLIQARLADGRVVDITISDGVIAGIEPHGGSSVEEIERVMVSHQSISTPPPEVTDNPEGQSIPTTQGSGNAEGSYPTLDLDGRLLLPAWAEPHAHLDKAFTADQIPNPTGDLMSAIEGITQAWREMSLDDVQVRATRAVQEMVACGTTAIRSHFDLTPDSRTVALEAMLEVREQTKQLCFLHLVPLAFPLVGPESGIVWKNLRSALEKGVDLVGGCPHIESDPVQSIQTSLSAAVDFGLPVDLHFDETLDPQVQFLPELCREVDKRGWGGKVTASHCVSHGMQDPERQQELARMLADSGVAVVVNPRTNLYLGGREARQATPRGLAGVRTLLEENVLLAGGADNLQDPFCPVGSPDPLETAFLLVLAAHVDTDMAIDLIGDNPRRLIGLARNQIEVGGTADLVAVKAESVRELVSYRPADRLVFYRGRLVSETKTETVLT